MDDFGILKVVSDDNKLLNSVYVKCYFIDKQRGDVKFYKDGYTDFRGSFDYASLNSDSLSKVSKFSILVTDEKYGSSVVNCNPPSLTGRIVEY